MMRAVVVYESMFGNTHEVAERIGDGLRASFEVTVLAVDEAIGTIVSDIDLLVVGGPTHAHGMSSSLSRRSASDQAASDDRLELEPGADGPGLREWFDALPRIDGHAAAAFDTRVDGPPMLTGRASRGIARRLTRHGFRMVDEPESYLVDKQNRLLDGEAERAARWGERLVSAFSTAA
jgi:hypothetical protein